MVAVELLSDRGLLPVLRVSALPHPFLLQRKEHGLSPGESITEVLRAISFRVDSSTIVILDGRIVPRDDWAQVVPRADQHMIVRNVPTGSKKSPLRTVLGIVGMAASFIVPGLLGFTFGSFAFTATSIGVGLASNLAINALIPPPKPSVGPLPANTLGLSTAAPTISSAVPGAIASKGGPKDAIVPTITGTQNQANQYGVIPVVFGRRRVYPTLAAQPYTEIVGSDQYLRQLFAVWGPLEVEDIKIGNTPIENYTGVELEVRQGFEDDEPITLYPNDVLQDAFALPLREEDGFVTRTAPQEADELSVDITFDRGLCRFTNSGGKAKVSVELEIEYKLSEDTEWTAAPESPLVVEDKKAATVFRGIRWEVPRGNYDVRVRRVTEDSDNARIIDECSWTALRAIKTDPPIRNISGLCVIALRIKATDQLNGVVDQLNFVGTSILPVWDGEDWIEEPTRLAAWSYVHVLTGPPNRRAISKSKIDTAAMLAWAEADAAAERYYDDVIDEQTLVFDLAREIAAVGRASFSHSNGKYSVVRDVPQDTPVQFFGPRNSSGFQASKTFVDLPHALAVQFINPDADWQQDEILVYDDGYSADGLVPGTVAADPNKVEKLVIRGCTSAAQAWKEGRYHIAVGRLRPETYTINVDFEHLICTRGDLVLFNHDVPQFGLGQARVKSLLLDDSDNLLGVIVDSAFPMEAGRSYACRFRSPDFTSVLLEVLTVPGENHELHFTLPPGPEDPAPEVGDLVLFGELGREGVEMLVKQIEPGPDLTAKITLIDHAPAVHLADQGEIPAFDTQITRPADFHEHVPPPEVAQVRSNEEVMRRGLDGSFESVISIALRRPGANVRYWQARFRETDAESDWTQLPPVPVTTDELIIAPVEDGVSYDIRIKAITRAGLESDWTAINGHVVIGKLTPPPPVGPLTLENNILEWPYPDKPLDFAGFLVRVQDGENFNWTTARRCHDGLVSSSAFLVTNQGTGLKTFLVKAVDTSGNESTEHIGITKFIPEIELGNIISVRDYEAEGFPGDITGGTVIGTNIEASDSSQMWTGVPASLFWSQPSNLMWDNAFDPLEYVAAFNPDSQDVPALMTLETVFQGQATIEFRFEADRLFWDEDDDAPFWGDDEEPFWPILFTDWLAWTGAVNASDTNYEFRVRIPGGKEKGLIDKFKVRLSVPDKTESLSDVEIPDTGARLNLQKGPYRYIKSVIPGLQDGGDGKSVRIVDKDPVNGPLVRIYDLSDEMVAGTIDALVVGY